LSKPTVAPIEYFTIPEIRKQFLPFCRQTLQRLFLNQPGVLIVGRRESVDPSKVAEGEPWRRRQKLYVPKVVIDRIMRETMVTR
jgi:hypothetical protein